MSNVNGSSKTSSSRFALTYQMLTLSPAFELLAAELGVLGDVAAEVHDRRRPAHDLLGRRPRERRVLHEQLVLVGVVAERADAVRDRVARGLVAGDRDQQEEEVEVHLRERVAVDLGVEQRRHDVVARHLAAFGRELRWRT